MKDERLEEIISDMELWAEYYDKTHESTIDAQTSYNYSAELRELITQEQSRRAVQPEEVQEVIDDLDCLISEITINEHIPIAYRTVVTKAITALRKMQGWIPCSERLPENGTTVLTFYKDNSGYEEFRASDYDDTKYQPYWNNVTHWMPLPEPPIVEAKGEKE